MIPVLLRLGPIIIYSSGLMMALGFLAADLVIALECRRRGITSQFSSAVVVWAAIVGLAGARLLDIFNNWPAYMADPKLMIFSGSGFIWYGGDTLEMSQAGRGNRRRRRLAGDERNEARSETARHRITDPPDA